MKTNRTDRRIEKTIKATETAYFELLSEKKNDRITITELADRANIDRKTFYLHYNSVDDVIDRHSRATVARIMAELGNKGFFNDVLDVSVFFETVLAVREEELQEFEVLQDPEITALAWRHAENNLKDMLSDIAYRFFDEPDPEMELSIKFYTAGIMSIFVSYIRQEIDIDPHELVRILSDLTENGISNKLKSDK
jgi:AcrR family transcriptional regulator